MMKYAISDVCSSLNMKYAPRQLQMLLTIYVTFYANTTYQECMM